MAYEDNIESVKIYIGNLQSNGTVSYSNIRPDLSADHSYNFADTMSNFSDFKSLNFAKVITSTIE